jgi:hypothetical protein
VRTGKDWAVDPVDPPYDVDGTFYYALSTLHKADSKSMNRTRPTRLKPLPFMPLTRHPAVRGDVTV